MRYKETREINGRDQILTYLNCSGTAIGESFAFKLPSTRPTGQSMGHVRYLQVGNSTSGRVTGPMLDFCNTRGIEGKTRKEKKGRGTSRKMLLLFFTIDIRSQGVIQRLPTAHHLITRHASRTRSRYTSPEPYSCMLALSARIRHFSFSSCSSPLGRYGGNPPLLVLSISRSTIPSWSSRTR